MISCNATDIQRRATLQQLENKRSENLNSVISAADMGIPTDNTVKGNKK